MLVRFAFMELSPALCSCPQNKSSLHGNCQFLQALPSGSGISSALAFQLVLLKMHSKRTETAPG